LRPSIGVPYITTYTKLYGNEVSGLVYVDDLHPNQSSVSNPRSESPAGLSWAGIQRLGEALLAGTAPNAPHKTLRISNAFASKSLGPVLSEMDAIAATFDALRAFRRLAHARSPC
jgi:hypothetical protein